MSDKVKVAVRVRPFNKREVDLGAKCVVDMPSGNKSVVLRHPNPGPHSRPSKTFTYDHCFWSFGPTLDASNTNDANFASQQIVFSALGPAVLEDAFDGYNACIFAYGQTGSGKSFTMMGSESNQGLIPRLCKGIFDRIASCQGEAISFKVEASYMEIYCEKVRDLVNPQKSRQTLRVREHNILGPYVDGLSCLAVNSYADIENLMDEGNQSRTVAATSMNAESSRSHAVFTIRLTATLVDLESGASGEKVSKVSLVDLAGSERATKSGAVGKRLEEGGNINKSLTTLGMVISALADSKTQNTEGQRRFVPYRDSVLTWLLKDSLGGNSRTIMVATVSPSADNYEETLSTMRYAERAKRIFNHAVVNEDPNARIIRELRSEVDALRNQIQKQIQSDELSERLAESEKLMAEMSRSWAERLREAEKIHQERQKALSAMGIEVQQRGIKVEQNKSYLVNLNADPTLNELLVYHLNDETSIGCDPSSDICLQGLGVKTKHAKVLVVDDKLYIEPVDDARTCVNGMVITGRTPLKNGHRVLIGNNHFFRVNCPRDPNDSRMEESSTTIVDYDLALNEVLAGELAASGGDNPVIHALDYLERQQLARKFEEDKAEALDRQRQLYEKHINDLRSIMSPMTPGLEKMPTVPWLTASSTPFGKNDVQERFVEIIHDRESRFRASIARLREEIGRANKLAREANFIASEMCGNTNYSVTLQIPPENLRPNKIKDWRQRSDTDRAEAAAVADGADVFFESQQHHSLIGVANVFLEVLFHDVRLDYHVPIISQQGEVSGRLHVEIGRVLRDDDDAESIASSSAVNNAAPLPLGLANGAAAGAAGGGQQAECGGDGPNGQMNSSVASDGSSPPAERFSGRTIAIRIRVKSATGVPPSLANFVFCQYSLPGSMAGSGSEQVVVVPPVDAQLTNNDAADGRIEREAHGPCTIHFNHESIHEVLVTDEFLEYCTDDALSIEVWGHKSQMGQGLEHDPMQKAKTLHERWAEVTRRISLNLEVHELNDQGEYTPVEVQRPSSGAMPSDVLTGGVYQLKQGQQRRLLAQVQVSDRGALPLVPLYISSIAIGCVCVRHRALQKPLDSYQEGDLELIREKWTDALQERRQYLDEQIQRLIRKPNKTEEDSERETSLIGQWVALTEERNAVCVPAPNSHIPGAPADWTPPPGYEHHVPVIYLDVNPDDMSTPADPLSPSLATPSVPIAGMHSIVPKEHTGRMFSLPVVKRMDGDECTAIASWDSSLHEHPALLRPTPG